MVRDNVRTVAPGPKPWVSVGRRIFVVATVVLTLFFAVWLIRRPLPPVPDPPVGTFPFAALGDAPYNAWEEMRYERVLRQVGASSLTFVLHVGDLFGGRCDDDLYRRRFASLRELGIPVVYTPGDNEWADCHSPRRGRFAPLDRLAFLRRVFFPRDGSGLTGKIAGLVSQADADGPGREFVENARWQIQGVFFVTVHLVGSRNAGMAFPGRSPADDEASVRRTAAAVSWLREAFGVAESGDARALVIAFHADPGLDQPVDDTYRVAYEPFLEILEREAEAFARPVLLVHGDSHEFVADLPLSRRTTGRRLENVMRLEVPGSPDVGWVRVLVNPAAVSVNEMFSFENRVVPRWKTW